MRLIFCRSVDTEIRVFRGIGEGGRDGGSSAGSV